MAAIAGSVNDDGSVSTSEDGKAANLYSSPMHAGMEPRPAPLGRYARREIGQQIPGLQSERSHPTGN